LRIEQIESSGIFRTLWGQGAVFFKQNTPTKLLFEATKASLMTIVKNAREAELE